MHYVIKIPNSFDASVSVKPLFSSDEVISEDWINIRGNETCIHKIIYCVVWVESQETCHGAPTKWRLGVGWLPRWGASWRLKRHEEGSVDVKSEGEAKSVAPWDYESLKEGLWKLGCLHIPVFLGDSWFIQNILMFHQVISPFHSQTYFRLNEKSIIQKEIAAYLTGNFSI